MVDLIPDFYLQEEEMILFLLLSAFLMYAFISL
jgi:hypothetical protein